VLFNLPAMVGSFHSWSSFLGGGAEQWKVCWTFNSSRGADLGSLWLAVQSATGHHFSPHTINVWSWALFGTWCAVVLAVGMLAPRMPRFAQLGFLIVAGFLIVNKVYSPQYVLWLLPLAVLARPRWRDQLVWQGTEVLYFAGVWWYLAGELAAGDGSSTPFYWLMIVIRVIGQTYLIGMVLSDMYAPHRDPVAVTEDEDAARAAGWVAPDGDTPQSTAISSNVVVV